MTIDLCRLVKLVAHWHIVSVSKKPVLYSADIQKMTGLSRRSVARHAQAGSIPGAIKYDGTHYAFHNSPALRHWCSNHDAGIITLEGINAGFLMWERKMRDEIPKMGKKELKRLEKLLRPFVEVGEELKAELKAAGVEV